MSRDVPFCEVAQGRWGSSLEVCAKGPSVGVVVLDSCEFMKPLRKALAQLFRAPLLVRWTSGAGDGRTVEAYDHLWGDYSGGDLHGRSREIDGIVVAKPGGLFRRRMRFPPDGGERPEIIPHEVLPGGIRLSQRWRAGLRHRHRDAVYLDDVTATIGTCAEILVSHWAPHSVRSDFWDADLASSLGRARLMVHARGTSRDVEPVRDTIPTSELFPAKCCALVPRTSCKERLKAT